MKTTNIKTANYSPGNPPADPSQVQGYLRDELRAISQAVQMLQDGHLDRQTAPPAKPRDGDIRLANGTTWNPGSGQGIYWYDATTSTWKFLG